MTADEIIARAKDLPVVSETARKLTVQLNQPQLHRDDLVKTVRCDSVLTAKLLRICNSAEMGVKEPVVSIDHALLILGDDCIFRMVCAIGFGDALGMNAPGYATEANGLWAHSLNAAVASEYLATRHFDNIFLPPTAFTAGLLHDMGKMVISRILTSKYRIDIRTKIAEHAFTRDAAEREVLGADHCQVGAALLTKWGLPEPIIEAVKNHNQPVIEPQPQLSAVVYLANCSAHLSKATPGWQAHATQAKKTAAELLKMEYAKVDELINSAHEAFEKFPQLKAAA